MLSRIPIFSISNIINADVKATHIESAIIIYIVDIALLWLM